MGRIIYSQEAKPLTATTMTMGASAQWRRAVRPALCDRLFDTMAGFEAEYAFAQRQAFHSVCTDDDCRARPQTAQFLEDFPFALDVDCARRLIQHQQTGFAENCTCQRN